LLGVWKGVKFYSPPCWQAKIAFLRCHLNRYLRINNSSYQTKKHEKQYRPDFTLVRIGLIWFDFAR
jgi:hypothetical protein